MGDAPHDTDERPDAGKPSTPLSEKQRRELWLYVGVSICAVELLLTVAALLFGFMAKSGGPAFPWIAWGVGMVLGPALLLLAVHLANVGLFRPAPDDAEWQRHLPERLQRFYRIIKGAPTVVVLLVVVVLGVALLTLDEALGALSRFGAALAPYIPHLVIGTAAVLLAAIGAGVWLTYRTRRLREEYAFRREVLERTGIVIVDKGSTALPGPGADNRAHPVLESGEVIDAKALPAGDDQTAGDRPASPTSNK